MKSPLKLVTFKKYDQVQSANIHYQVCLETSSALLVCLLSELCALCKFPLSFVDDVVAI